MTGKAFEQIQGVSKKNDIKLYLYKQTEMPVLKSIFTGRDLNRAASLLGVQADRVDSTALTYFDHKIPNSMSFPCELARKGGIPTHEAPYKQFPFVPGSGEFSVDNDFEMTFWVKSKY